MRGMFDFLPCHAVDGLVALSGAPLASLHDEPGIDELVQVIVKTRWLPFHAFCQVEDREVATGQHPVENLLPGRGREHVQLPRSVDAEASFPGPGHVQVSEDY